MKTKQLETLEPFCNKRDYGSGDSLEIRREQWQVIRGLNPALQRTWETLSWFLPEMIDPHYRSSWEERQPSTACTLEESWKEWISFFTMLPLHHSVPAITDSTVEGGMACLFFLKAGKECFESYVPQELHGIVNFTEYSQNTKAHMGFGGGGGLAHPSGYLRKHIRLCVKVWGGRGLYSLPT